MENHGKSAIGVALPVVGGRHRGQSSLELHGEKARFVSPFEGLLASCCQNTKLTMMQKIRKDTEKKHELYVFFLRADEVSQKKQKSERLDKTEEHEFNGLFPCHP